MVSLLTVGNLGPGNGAFSISVRLRRGLRSIPNASKHRGATSDRRRADLQIVDPGAEPSQLPIRPRSLSADGEHGSRRCRYRSGTQVRAAVARFRCVSARNPGQAGQPAVPLEQWTKWLGSSVCSRGYDVPLAILPRPQRAPVAYTDARWLLASGDGGATHLRGSQAVLQFVRFPSITRSLPVRPDFLRLRPGIAIPEVKPPKTHADDGFFRYALAHCAGGLAGANPPSRGLPRRCPGGRCGFAAGFFKE